jgi:lipoprotein-anchoring transpeptidase ErfK/SrfK
MLLRLLRLFVFAAAPITLAALPARAASEKVQYTGDAKPGTIVIQTSERRLYLITGKDQALKYPVGVGRTGQQWFGTTRIASKHIKPAWKPPVSLRGKRSPDFYIEGGSPKNPMGDAALVLVDHELAIHGTNNPGSIGGFVSAGCIRMHNRDIMDLYGRVNVGTRVVFVKPVRPASGAPDVQKPDVGPALQGQTPPAIQSAPEGSSKTTTEPENK